MAPATRDDTQPSATPHLGVNSYLTNGNTLSHEGRAERWLPREIEVVRQALSKGLHILRPRQFSEARRMQNDAFRR